MRTFYFKARNIGQEKYLTYTMGEETELDEDVLDYCEENDVKELVDIIYEEDDDYDYLTYDITNKVSLKEMMADEISTEQVLFIVRNVAGNLISIKEQAIHLSYILLNREYVYVGNNNNVFFICVPVENKGSLSVEFKGFLRQLLANMKYNCPEGTEVLVDFTISGGEEPAAQQAQNPFMPRPRQNNRQQQGGASQQPKK